MASIPELGLTPDHDLGAVHTLPEFRAIIDSNPMTPAERETLAEQAEAMIDGLYVHLLQKRAMYGIDPAQRLRLLRRRLAQMPDAQFHAELLRIFTELRDLHTNYILPTLTRDRSPSWASCSSSTGRVAMIADICTPHEGCRYPR